MNQLEIHHYYAAVWLLYEYNHKTESTVKNMIPLEPDLE